MLHYVCADSPEDTRSGSIGESVLLVATNAAGVEGVLAAGRLGSRLGAVLDALRDLAGATISVVYQAEDSLNLRRDEGSGSEKGNGGELHGEDSYAV